MPSRLPSRHIAGVHASADALVDEIAWRLRLPIGCTLDFVVASKQPALSPSHLLTLPQAICALNNSRSQFSEDLFLLPTLLLAASSMRSTGKRHPPTFVELGALDGERYSNTLMLERCFGWRGLLIEANPANFGALQHSQRQSTWVHSAVCAASKDGTPRVVRMMRAGTEFSSQRDVLSAEKVRSLLPRLHCAG